MVLGRFLPLLVLTACGASTGSQLFTDVPTPDAAVAADATPDATPDPTCLVDAKTTLPGVYIRFAPQTCTFTLAQAKAGISIAYDVVVDADLAGVVPGGQPWQAGAGASGLLTFELLSGSGQRYCLCDLGLGPALPTVPITLKQGTYPMAFTWDGHDWEGPSDTGNPKGPLFPVGTYRLDVTATGTVTDPSGTRVFDVSGAFRVTLVP
jgi:hypothetical protein